MILAIKRQLIPSKEQTKKVSSNIFQTPKSSVSTKIIGSTVTPNSQHMIPKNQIPLASHILVVGIKPKHHGGGGQTTTNSSLTRESQLGKLSRNAANSMKSNTAKLINTNKF